jgi:hypothetical protein
MLAVGVSKTCHPGEVARWRDLMATGVAPFEGGKAVVSAARRPTAIPVPTGTVEPLLT